MKSSLPVLLIGVSLEQSKFLDHHGFPVPEFCFMNGMGLRMGIMIFTLVSLLFSEVESLTGHLIFVEIFCFLLLIIIKLVFD